MQKPLSTRIRFVALLNLLFALFYFYLFLGAIRKMYDFQIPLYLLSFAGLLGSSVFLLQRKKLGKLLVRFSGWLGIAAIVSIATWYLSYFFNPKYNIQSIKENLIVGVLIFTVRHAYPIIAGFIILNKPDEELGLQ